MLIPLPTPTPSRALFEHGVIQVWRRGDVIDVEHHSASGGSLAVIARFAAEQRDEAVARALAECRNYAPCRLGEVAPWEC